MSRSRSRRQGGGFTLIEAMIAVTVVAIVATIALPSYMDYLQRSKLVEAKVALSDLRTRLEQYFLDARAYPSACVPPAPGPAPAGQIYLPVGTKYFSLVCVLSASAFTVTATGTDANGMGGFVFTVDEMDRRTTVALPGGWKGAGSPCWVSRRSGEC